MEKLAEYRKGKHLVTSKMTPEERALQIETMRKEEWEARGIVAQNAAEFAIAYDKDDHGGFLVRPSTLWDEFKEQEYDTDIPPPIEPIKKEPWWKKLIFWR